MRAEQPRRGRGGPTRVRSDPECPSSSGRCRTPPGGRPLTQVAQCREQEGHEGSSLLPRSLRKYR
eukprot:2727354-Alexandrium_andersonii.AAC.1